MAASVRFNLIYYLGDLWPISSSAGVVFFFLAFFLSFPPLYPRVGLLELFMACNRLFQSSSSLFSNSGLHCKLRISKHVLY